MGRECWRDDSSIMGWQLRVLTDRKTVDGTDNSKHTAAWDYLVKGERGRRDPLKVSQGLTDAQTSERGSSRVHLVHVTQEEDNNSVHFGVCLEYNIK